MEVRQQHDIVLYQIDETNICISVVYEDETFWLTQKAMAEFMPLCRINCIMQLQGKQQQS